MMTSKCAEYEAEDPAQTSMPDYTITNVNTTRYVYRYLECKILKACLKVMMSPHWKRSSGLV